MKATENPLRAVAIAAILVVGSIGLPACEEEGPAERAGEKIDSIVEQAGKKVEEAGDAVRDATND